MTAAPSRLWLSFVRTGGQTELAELRQETPLRALFPRPSAGEPPEAVLVTTSGGLVGGDRLEVAIAAGARAAALVTSQAAEKVYRSAGPDVDVRVRLAAATGAWLEWLPQETIVFDGARLRRTTEADLDPSARLLAADIVVFGRTAYGERLTTGLLVDGWRVRRGGRLQWADTLRLFGDLRDALDAPFGLGGARAVATLLYAGADAADWLDPVRRLLPQAPARCGATALPGLLIVRWLGEEPAAVRRGVAEVATHLRHRIAGLPPRLPTAWWT